MSELVPAYAKVSTVGVAGSVDAPKVDLAMPVMPKNLDQWEPHGYVDQVEGVTFTAAKDFNAKKIAGIFNVSDAYLTGTYTYGSTISYDEPLPESMCGNCRRDWHEAPLTEGVARMYDQLAFDENYDPADDTSRVVCPGSECCGPVVAKHPNVGLWTSEFSPINGPSWIQVMNGQLNMAHLVLGPDWKGGFDGYSQYVEHFAGSWTFEPSPVEKMQKTLQGMQDAIQILMGDEPPLEVKTWFPDHKDAQEFPFVDDGVQQAAIEAAPKAIEMDHKLPVPPGFDFSDIKDIPGYYQPPKGKKKK